MRRNVTLSLLFVVGIIIMSTTMLHAQTFWTGLAGDGNWNTAGNWNPSTVPNSNSVNVVISTMSPTTITMANSREVQNLTVSGDVTLQAGTGTLTAASLNVSVGTLTLRRTSNSTNTFLALASMSLSGAILRHASSSSADVRITVAGNVSMTNVTNAYTGEGVRVQLASDNALQSAARFDGELNIPDGLRLGAHDLYLGKNATVTGVDAFGSNGDGFIHTDGDADTPMGTIKRQYDAVGQSFYFPIGPLNGRQSPLLLTIAPMQTNPSLFSSATPWPHISVRCLLNGNQGHPMNSQNSKIWVYWVVKGYGVNEPVLLNGTMYLHNNYRSGAPAVYSARWTPHYEDFLGALGFWDLTGSQPGTTTGSDREVPFMGFPGFGDYNIGKGTAGGDPVPVELVSFSVRASGGNAVLQWRTATELNNAGFHVERSVRADEWENVGFVPGAGSSYIPRSYTWTDLLSAGLRSTSGIRYRLRQVDRDGTETLSPVVELRFGAAPDAVALHAAYPNPFNPSTTLSFSLREAGAVTVRVYNAFGQDVATLLNGAWTDAGYHSLGFTAQGLPSGTYLVTLTAGGETRQQRILLNK
ncbi:MAG TPA: T9SS type A sorting domain-containing protein [Bacteroidota bacterium]|nr:T9SS type A sorting domain-containing protein [Bacteroidota bacterium]